MMHKLIIMKNILFIACIFLTACNTPTKQRADAAPDSTDKIINAGAANDSGAALIAKNDCLTCHSIDKKMIGPSYKQVADKYESNAGNIDKLSHSIIDGSKGLWGDSLQHNGVMTPHPNLSYNDAETMVKYILSLKNKNNK
jgi:cytochrome c